ncbi:MAG: helix-turn-helix transcriptional regulator, partial [Clostridia bacterium]|nr:helix-turn-helix transcriptional regulator [Clostridia bacterium]
IKTVEQMEKKENFSIGISRMVELSEKSIEHLSRSMRKYYGCSPTEHINALRIDYMSSMLAYSTLPIIDIWMDVGFESAGYAYKLFKQRYGVTPQQYRKHTN